MLSIYCCLYEKIENICFKYTDDSTPPQLPFVICMTEISTGKVPSRLNVSVVSGMPASAVIPSTSDTFTV